MKKAGMMKMTKKMETRTVKMITPTEETIIKSNAQVVLKKDMKLKIVTMPTRIVTHAEK